MIKLRRYIILITFLSVFGISIFSCGSDDITPPSNTQEILIGGLLSLTGDWSSLGETSKAGMEIGVQEINTYLSQSGSNLRIKLLIEDTKLDSTLALEKLKVLEKNGVKVVIGPQSSAEVNAIKSYADEKGIIIISQSSTAHSLAIPDDNILRFCPDDILEGNAIASLMWNDGIKAIVPMWRDDTGNNGLYTSTKSKFESLGGKVFDGVKYAPATQDFSSCLQNLSSQTGQAVTQYGGTSVGIYLAAFDEVVSIFNKAHKDSALSSVKWYGSDGVAQSNTLLNDSQAAQFGVTSVYPNPIFGLEEQSSDIWKPLSQQIKDEIGREPDAFALASYDALWVAGKAYMATGNINNTSVLRNTIIETADSYYGATGWTKLNNAGDRTYGTFDFWAIRNISGSLQWKKVAIYTSSGNIIRIQ